MFLISAILIPGEKVSFRFPRLSAPVQGAIACRLLHTLLCGMHKGFERFMLRLTRDCVSHLVVGNLHNGAKERLTPLVDSRPCSHTPHSPTHAFGVDNLRVLSDPAVRIFKKIG